MKLLHWSLPLILWFSCFPHYSCCPSPSLKCLKVSQVIILAICPGFQIGMFSVFCLFLLIICFHCSWLWIYHLIILTSLSLLLGHFKITCISQLQTYTMEVKILYLVPLFSPQFCQLCTLILFFTSLSGGLLFNCFF